MIDCENTFFFNTVVLVIILATIVVPFYVVRKEKKQHAETDSGDSREQGDKTKNWKGLYW
jgi:hypothetical protein